MGRVINRCINDGSCTRLDVNTGRESAIDLTIVSNVLGGIISLEVLKKCSIGSDHFPIISVIVNNGNRNINQGNIGKWKYEKGDWEKFKKVSEEGLKMIKMDEDIGIRKYRYRI